MPCIGTDSSQLSPIARETAFLGKEAAESCLNVFTQSPNFVRHLQCKYTSPLRRETLTISDATREPLVAACLAAVYLLRMSVQWGSDAKLQYGTQTSRAILYPDSFDPSALSAQVSETVRLLLAECHADRYAMAVRVVHAEFRRRTKNVLNNHLQQAPAQDFLTSDQQLQETLLGADWFLSVPQDTTPTDLQHNPTIDWDQLLNPTFDPGFTWNSTMIPPQQDNMTGSLQPVSGAIYTWSAKELMRPDELGGAV